MANNSINLVNLDFDTLKDSLKTYLRGQSKFSDYDFDGSNMSVLLDILTYNTHLNAFYLNMVTSEMFLDSAQLRNSVISIAKGLNYTPRSTKSSRAVLNLRFPQSGLQSFSIPEGTRFVGKNSRGTFQFLTNESMILYPANGFFTASNVTVYDGLIVRDAFVINYSVEAQRFVLTNDTIDTDSIRVLVSEDNGQTDLSYSVATSLFGVNGQSQVCFVQATEDTRYEIVFGDGVFGRKPKDGSTVIVTYRAAAGPLANESTNFVLGDNLGALNGFGSAITPVITVVSPGFDGGEAETIEEIRYRAPRFYQTQERAITTNDFATLVLQQFQNVKNVYVYGGELSSSAPKFGTVFVSPITFSGVPLSQSEKNSIETYLKQRTTVGLVPSVVDPDYLYVSVVSNIKYRSQQTTLSGADIEALAKSAIQNFNENELNDFNTELNLSKLETAINAVDPSIVGNQTELTIKKIFTTELSLRSFPTVLFRNEIVPGTLISSEFISNGRRYQYTDFNPNNNTLTARVIEGRTVVTNSVTTVYLKDITNPSAITYVEAGNVNYAEGTVAINSIVFNSFEGKSGLEMSAKPASQDVSSKDNDVIAIDTEFGVRVVVRSIDG